MGSEMCIRDSLYPCQLQRARRRTPRNASLPTVLRTMARACEAPQRFIGNKTSQVSALSKQSKLLKLWQTIHDARKKEVGLALIS